MRLGFGSSCRRCAMSAALVILPVVWATESFEPESFDSEFFETGTLETEILETEAADQYVGDEEEAQQQVAPEMAFYRKYTEAMLRRYVSMSMEAGRVPALLGKEMFRGKVTSCRMQSFDDVVIFVHDVTRCLHMLTQGQQYLIRRIALQEYTQAETAAATGIPLRTVHRRYARALDELTEIFLERRLLEPRMACHEAGSVRY
jgi:hypothetical protein